MAVFVLQGFAAHREGIPAPKRGRRPIVATLPPLILAKQTGTTEHGENIKCLTMRTLLNESFPPNCMAEPMFSASEPARIFSQSAVLGKLDDLVEVGVGE